MSARAREPPKIFLSKSTKRCARKTRTRSKRSPKSRRRRFYGRAPSVSSAIPRSRPTSPMHGPTFTTDEEIDQAYHLGYDLSVTKHYPAEAANHGDRRLRRRSGHLRQHGDHRPWARLVHPLLASEFHRRQSRRQGQAENSPSARPAKPALPAAITCTSASISTASRSCRWNGGIRNGLRTTCSPSSMG